MPWWVALLLVIFLSLVFKEKKNSLPPQYWKMDQQSKLSTADILKIAREAAVETDKKLLQ